LAEGVKRRIKKQSKTITSRSGKPIPRKKIKMSKINPEHYKFGGVECIDAIKSSLSPEQFKGYLKASIIKYLWRYEKKNGLEDLEKADWFLRKLRYEVEHE